MKLSNFLQGAAVVALGYGLGQYGNHVKAENQAIRAEKIERMVASTPSAPQPDYRWVTESRPPRQTIDVCVLNSTSHPVDERLIANALGTMKQDYLKHANITLNFTETAPYEADINRLLGRGAPVNAHVFCTEPHNYALVFADNRGKGWFTGHRRRGLAQPDAQQAIALWHEDYNDLAHVASHEIGHLVSLHAPVHHSADVLSFMYPTIVAGEQGWRPEDVNNARQTVKKGLTLNRYIPRTTVANTDGKAYK